MLNVKYSEVWKMMNTLLTWYSEVHALVQEESLPASVFRAWESGECCTQKECIRTTSNALSILNLRTCVASWINSNPSVICNIFFNDEAHFTRDGETPIYGVVIIHMELSKATTNIAFL